MSVPLAAGEHEGLLQVGLRLGGLVLAAVFVFSMGAWFGIRVGAGPSPEAPAAPAPALPQVAPVVAAPGTPPAPLSPGRLTFYDRLSGAAPPPTRLPEGEAPGQPATPAPAASAALAAPPAQPLPPAQPQPAPQPATAAKPAAAAGAPAGKTARAAPAPPPPSAEPAARIRKLTGPGDFAVQVAAVSDRAAATEAAERLRRQGFDVVTVMASAKGKTVYRLRVGSFPSRPAAEKAAAIFRADLGFAAIPVRD